MCYSCIRLENSCKMPCHKGIPVALGRKRRRKTQSATRFRRRLSEFSGKHLRKVGEVIEPNLKGDFGDR